MHRKVDCPPEERGYPKHVWNGRLRSEMRSNPLPFYIPFFTEKVPLSYTFHWEMVPLSRTSLKDCVPFNPHTQFETKFSDDHLLYGYEIWRHKYRWLNHFWVKMHFFSSSFNNKSKYCDKMMQSASLCVMSSAKKLAFTAVLTWLLIGHFRVPPSLCFKTRVGAQPLIWKSFFILTQIKLIFTRKVVHLASFWKWVFLELGTGLFLVKSKMATIVGDITGLQ